MIRRKTTELSDHVEVGQLIQPFLGKDEHGQPYKPSSFSSIQAPRNTAQTYLVECAEMGGGGMGHGPYDVFPDGWHVTARRIPRSGEYDPRQPTVSFYQSGCFTDTIVQVPVVGRMRRTFVREE